MKRYEDDPYKNFKSEEEAKEWMASLDLEHQDNYRFTYKNDSYGYWAYRDIKFGGCCGSFDHLIRIQGRKAYIGCNYGH
jgi:hypothetical protein|tara:strand:+ start:206 stop:442 length:237 start_codon:yes stop_codon:yes gene_type:complete